jgi:predicted ester cyclase
MENEKLNVLRQVVEEGFGNADLYVIDQLVADNCIEHQFGMRGGKEGLKKAILSLASAFSNHQYNLIHFSVNGDIVWVHYHSSGEHTGSFMGHEPTGKKFSIDVIDVARVENGKITEHWGVPDRFALLMQLGFLHPTNPKA